MKDAIAAVLASYSADWWELQLTRHGQTLSACVLRESVPREDAEARLATLTPAALGDLWAAALLRDNAARSASWAAAMNDKVGPLPPRIPDWP